VSLVFACHERQACHLLEETIVNAEPKNDATLFTREEAKRTLDEIRRRYGIQESDFRDHSNVGSFSNPSAKAARQLRRPTVKHQRSACKAPTVPVEPVQSEPNLELQKVRHRDAPASASLPENKIFHYLIQIAECAVALHCEVTAECESDARYHVKQIPNLMEWREILDAELGEMIKNEKARSKKTKKARLSGGVAAPF
jgi:hypothetical protein